MTIQVGPFSALKHDMDQFRQSLSFKQIVRSLYSSTQSSHKFISHQENDAQLNHLTTPLCSGIFGCWVDIPARKHVEPLRLAHRTLTKSLGPTTFPGVSADTSWVTIVSWPIFWRICGNPLWPLWTHFYLFTIFLSQEAYSYCSPFPLCLTLTCLTLGFQSPICSIFPTSSLYNVSGCCSNITSSLNTFPMSGNVLLSTLSPLAWGRG